MDEGLAWNGFIQHLDTADPKDERKRDDENHGNQEWSRAMKRTEVMKRTANAVWLVAFVFGATNVAADVRHTFACTIRDGAAIADVFIRSADWLRAARSQQGGQNMKVQLEFPLAAEAGYRGFNYVVISANLAGWGEFYDNYANSPAAAADGPWEEVALCTKSVLYDAFDVGPPAAATEK
jgi:hypothetical protein